MADSIDIKVTGVKETLANLKEYQIVKTGAVKIAIKETGFSIEGDAKRNAAMKFIKGYATGRVMSSISTNWSGSPLSYGRVGGKASMADGIGRPPGPPGLVVVVGTNVDKYPIYLEFGTSKMQAVPFLHPAHQKNIPEFVARIKRIFKK